MRAQNRQNALAQRLGVLSAQTVDRPDDDRRRLSHDRKNLIVARHTLKRLIDRERILYAHRLGERRAPRKTEQRQTQQHGAKAPHRVSTIADRLRP